MTSSVKIFMVFLYFLDTLEAPCSFLKLCQPPLLHHMSLSSHITTFAIYFLILGCFHIFNLWVSYHCFYKISLSHSLQHNLNSAIEEMSALQISFVHYKVAFSNRSDPSVHWCKVPVCNARVQKNILSLHRSYYLWHYTAERWETRLESSFTICPCFSHVLLTAWQ